MPGGDRTGPMGMGPMTGRAAGYCAGYPLPGFMNYPAGPVLGAGVGYGAFPAAYGPAPYGAASMPFGYRAGYLPAYGRGFGRGFGRGRGRGRR